jgi:predicted GTPase
MLDPHELYQDIQLHSLSLTEKIEEYVTIKTKEIPTIISIGKECLGKSSLLNKIFGCEFTKTSRAKDMVNANLFQSKRDQNDLGIYDLIDTEGIDGNDTDNYKDILNLTLAFGSPKFLYCI